MALTRDFKQTVVERVERDPAFAQALLDEGFTDDEIRKVMGGNVARVLKLALPPR